MGTVAIYALTHAGYTLDAVFNNFGLGVPGFWPQQKLSSFHMVCLHLQSPSLWFILVTDEPSREMVKMTDVVTQLGTLYDDLARLQADAKIAELTEQKLVDEATFCSMVSSCLSPGFVCRKCLSYMGWGL